MDKLLEWLAWRFAILVVVLMILMWAYERCKSGKGGALTQICHYGLKVFDLGASFMGKIRSFLF
jgi:hypothetical protein